MRHIAPSPAYLSPGQMINVKDPMIRPDGITRITPEHIETRRQVSVPKSKTPVYGESEIETRYRQGFEDAEIVALAQPAKPCAPRIPSDEWRQPGTRMVRTHKQFRGILAGGVR